MKKLKIIKIIIRFLKAIVREIKGLWNEDTFPSLGGAKEMFPHHYTDEEKK